MHQRAAEILAAAVGLLVVAGLVVIGMDIRAAARRGPRWRRRLLGAGLAALGLVSMTPQDTPPTCYTPVPQERTAASLDRLEQQATLLEKLAQEGKLDPEVARKALAAAEAAIAEVAKADIEKLSASERDRAEDLRLSLRMKMECIRVRLDGGPRPLADSADWQKLTAVMDEAKAVAGGQMGNYPFDEAGQKRLLGDLDEAVQIADRLVAAKLLIDAEATLLKDDIEALKSGVLKKRPVEMRMATCYEAVAIDAKHPAVSLKDRLPLLEKMAAEEKLDPSVVRKALASVERDLAELEGNPKLMEHPEAEKTRDDVKAQLAKIKKLVEQSASK